MNNSRYDQSVALRNEGFAILPLSPKFHYHEYKNIASNFFPCDVEALGTIPRTDFHGVVESAQNALNSSGALESFVELHHEMIADIIGDDFLTWVSVMKLRAVRPRAILGASEQDHVDLHRESLYAVNTQVNFQYNCWIPLTGSATTSGMFYVPRSHIVPDSELVIRADPQSPVRVERFSAGHRIGLPYLPKSLRDSPLIANSPTLRFSVPSGCFVLFSAMLIHGGAQNDGDSLRLSMDTGVLPSRRIIHNSSLFASGGRLHYLSTSEIINPKHV